MNIFMPENPVVAVLLNSEGRIEKISHNLLENLKVSVMTDKHQFDEETKGLTFTVPKE